MKKVLAIVVALAMVMALAVPTFALEGSIEAKLASANNSDWGEVVSDTQTIDHPGEYTFKIDGFSYPNTAITTLYLKDDAVWAVEDPSAISGFTLTVKSIKVNGTEVEVSEGYPTTLNEKGQFDFAFYNTWIDNGNFITLPDGDITSFEVTVEIVDADAAAAEEPAAEEPAAEEPVAEEPAAEEPAAEEPEAPAADDASAPVEDGTAADNNTVAPSTGLVFAVIPAVVALAAAAVSKKH